MVHCNTGSFTSMNLMMWDVHSLKPIKLGNEIKLKLAKLPQGKLLDANFIGINEHIMITLKRETNDSHK